MSQLCSLHSAFVGYSTSLVWLFQVNVPTLQLTFCLFLIRDIHLTVLFFSAWINKYFWTSYILFSQGKKKLSLKRLFYSFTFLLHISLNKQTLLKCLFYFSQEKQEVVIEKIVRNKRKCVTVVKGLELFGKWF